MSQLIRTEHQVLRFRLAPRVSLALAALIAGGAIALPLAFRGNDDSTETPTTAASRLGLDVRYDGGPEEGSRGLVHPSSAAGVRYYGGPDESGHDIRYSSRVSTPQASTRYDGGPEEGTRGVGSTSTPSDAAGVRFDGGPEEGTRGLGR